MRILIFFILCFFNIFFCSAQNVIELKNTQTGKTRILKAGAKIHFKSYNDSTLIKGKIVQIKDTSIVIYCPDFEDDVPLLDIRLSDINEIKKPTSFHSISRSVGSILLPVGGLLFFNSVLVLSRDNNYQGGNTFDIGVAKTTAAIGGVFIIAGTLPFIIKPKVYNLKKDWTIVVKKLNK